MSHDFVNAIYLQLAMGNLIICDRGATGKRVNA
jgi:hypothetical protein